ncbi:hypothetical protein BRC81_14725 [Halobacteriales archaeon QS_1_68_20]|nr:MAG: hypothetical protein BRC81_14725 [Halobacteriales archaeon QS_1_68_20]
MLQRLGLFGILGLLAMLGGIALLGLVDLRIAAGVALVVGGIGLVTYGMVQSMMAKFGLA